MKVYLAGKISGDEDYREKFSSYEYTAKQMYDVVMNPAELAEGMSSEDYMAICLQMILRADAVLFMPDWSESAGARLEHQFCKYIGKPVMYLS